MVSHKCTGLLALLLLSSLAYSQNIEFPPLTGRVADRAELLNAATERELTRLLAAHERATSNQIVVATLENLQGYTIEQYGYRLGRHWGIGQKGEDNGALLLVAEAEREVRIEVGYGLEGELTDAISSSIIHSIILPHFKRGQFGAGISQGVRAMVQAVGGEYQAPAPTRAEPTATSTKALILFLVFGGWLALASLTSIGGHRRGSGGRLLLLGGLLALGGGRGGGGFGGGGFSGGGGGFGGGGASGGW